jgi:hypothetical protein
MKIGFHVVFFVLLFNLVCGLMYSISVPGTEYSNILGGTGDTSDYDERFNATEFMEKVEPEASETYTFVGNIWSGLQLIFNAISFVVAGLPILFIGISNQVGDPTAKAAVQTFGAIICSAAYFIIVLWLYQLFTGRSVD